MSFRKWLDKELNIYNTIKDDPKFGLSGDGFRYLNILNEINKMINTDYIEKFLREKIKSNINKKNYQYIYKQFLVCEGYIEGDLE